MIVTNNADRILYVTVETEREFQNHKEQATQRGYQSAQHNEHIGKSSNSHKISTFNTHANSQQSHNAGTS